MYKTAYEYHKKPKNNYTKYSTYTGPKRNEKSKMESNTEQNMTDPNVWGRHSWFGFHNGAAQYPISASPIAKSKMKSYIIGIPIMLPCNACQIHATNYIESNKPYMDEITSGRKNLFKFFVDFHNTVNKRLNKPVVSLEEAYKIYNVSL